MHLVHLVCFELTLDMSGAFGEFLVKTLDFSYSLQGILVKSPGVVFFFLLGSIFTPIEHSNFGHFEKIPIC